MIKGCVGTKNEYDGLFEHPLQPFQAVIEKAIKRSCNLDILQETRWKRQAGVLAGAAGTFDLSVEASCCEDKDYCNSSSILGASLTAFLFLGLYHALRAIM